jgi:hypothetical protein
VRRKEPLENTQVRRWTFLLRQMSTTAHNLEAGVWQVVNDAVRALDRHDVIQLTPD